MNYRTTCPSCASVFRLGEDQLGAAQGWVQCSVCGNAFDARLSLLLEDGSPLPPPEPEPVEFMPPPEEAVPPAEPETHAAAPAETAEAALEDRPEPAPAPEPAADTPRGIAQRETALDLDSIILIDPDIPVPEDPGPLPQIYPAPAPYPPEPAAPAPAPAPRQQPPSAPAARIEYASPAPGASRASLSRSFPSMPRRVRPWLWAAASAFLLLTLLAQTAYFLRDTLVSQLPQTRPAFQQLCSVLGCTLSLPKNLAQLQIVGSDLQTEAGGRLRLTLTLGNRAGHAQAWPVLVLTLTDQRDRPLARRSFAPSEYLEDARRIADGIPPRSEQVLSLPLTVRGPAPMGFDLQLGY